MSQRTSEPTSNPARRPEQHSIALTLVSPGQFELRQLDTAPGPGEVGVRVIEAGICGSDIKMYSGQHPVNEPPLVLGHEFYGELLSTPDQVPIGGITPGDVVMVFPCLSCGRCRACRADRPNVCLSMGVIGAQRPGALAMSPAVPASNIMPMHQDIPRALRILVEPLAVAVHAVNRAGPTDGQECLVVGAGPIGLFVALLLQHREAAAVTLHDSDSLRLDMAKRVHQAAETTERGAGLRCVPSIGNVQDEFDLVIDCVGSSKLAEEAVSRTRPGGKAVLVGMQSEPITFSGVQLQRGERSVIGVQLYTRQDFMDAMELLALAPRFRDLPATEIIRRNTLDDAPGVFARLAEGDHSWLKEVIVF